MVRKLLIAVALLVVIAVLGVFFAYRKFTAAGAKPLEIQNPAEVPEVKASLERRLNKVEEPKAPAGQPAAPSPAAGAAPVAGREEQLPITADELSALIDRLVPGENLKLKVAVTGGLARVQVSVPASEVKPHLGDAASYIDGSMKWLNIDMVASIAMTDGKLAIQVKEIRQPPLITVAALQKIVDGALAQRPAEGIRSIKGDPPFELTGLALEGDAAVVRVRRLLK